MHYSKQRILTALILLASFSCLDAQPTPFAGFMEGFGPKKGEIMLHTSGLFNTVQWAPESFFSLGITPQPSMLLGEDYRDWNANARLSVPFSPNFQMGVNTFFWRRSDDFNNNFYATYQLMATYGTRTRYFGLSGGSWQADMWGHYAFTYELSWFDYPSFTGESSGLGRRIHARDLGVHGAYSFRCWSGRFEGHYSVSDDLKMITASPALRYSLKGIRFEMGLTWLIYRETLPAFFFNGNDVTASYQPFVNIHVALSRKTRRYWREDLLAE